MIEKITLENFKGIGEETTIRLGPLTLLFGGNSSGKSTVLHALAYAREIFERHNCCNADKTMLGGDSLDLGGFKEMIHGHDETKKIKMRFDFKINRRPFFPQYHRPTNRESSYQPNKGWVQIEIGIMRKIYGIGKDFPCVLSYQVGYDDAPFAELKFIRVATDTYNKYTVNLHRLNINHNAIIDDSERDILESNFDNFSLCNFEECGSDANENEAQSGQLYLNTRLTEGALPALASRRSYHRPFWLSIKEKDESKTHNFEKISFGELERWIVHPSHCLHDLLYKLLYAGPIREIPARNHRISLSQKNSWANGLGAYDVLPVLKETEWKQITADLSGEGDEYLETGYELVYIPPYHEIKGEKLVLPEEKYFPPQFKEYIESEKYLESEDGGESFHKSFPNDEWFGLFDIKRKVLVQMHNVGVGLAQIIPLVVCMAKDKKQKLTLLFEQPELHLHPKQQAAVGDLLIRAAKSGTQIIAETHSIHLIQRVLRRIREYHANPNTALFDFVPDRDLFVQLAQSSETSGTRFRRMEVSSNGKFLRSWPDSFFDQELYEKMEGVLGDGKSFKQTDESIKKLSESLAEKIEKFERGDDI